MMSHWRRQGEGAQNFSLHFLAGVCEAVNISKSKVFEKSSSRQYGQKISVVSAFKGTSKR